MKHISRERQAQVFVHDSESAQKEGPVWPAPVRSVDIGSPRFFRHHIQHDVARVRYSGNYQTQAAPHKLGFAIYQHAQIWCI